MQVCSDDELARRFCAGSDEAFGVLHERYRGRLTAYVRNMLSGRSSEDVEDVVQDVFERAARTLRAGAKPTALRPWLYGVAHNRCIDDLRRRPPPPLDVFDMSRRPSSDPAAVAERRAEVDRLLDDVRALPELQRSVLLMREMRGLSHVELAAVLDVSVSTVKSALVRARLGLVDAEEARQAPCEWIRRDLAASHDRRVKATAQAARHMRDCEPCSSYRAELRRSRRRVAAFLPLPGFLPLGRAAKLFGGSGVHAGTPATATTIAGSGGAIVVGAGKIAATLSVATVVGTGAVLAHTGTLHVSLPWTSSAPGHHRAAPFALLPGASSTATSRATPRAATSVGSNTLGTTLTTSPGTGSAAALAASPLASAASPGAGSVSPTRLGSPVASDGSPPSRPPPSPSSPPAVAGTQLGGVTPGGGGLAPRTPPNHPTIAPSTSAPPAPGTESQMSRDGGPGSGSGPAGSSGPSRTDPGSGRGPSAGGGPAGAGGSVTAPPPTTSDGQGPQGQSGKNPSGTAAGPDPTGQAGKGPSGTPGGSGSSGKSGSTGAPSGGGSDTTPTATPTPGGP